MLKGISRKRLQNKQRSNDMKKITSKLVAVLMIVVMAFGISGTATVKTEAKESKGYVIKVNLVHQVMKHLREHFIHLLNTDGMR